MDVIRCYTNVVCHWYFVPLIKNRLIFLRSTRLLSAISRAINFSSETVSIKITTQHFLISARKCLTRFKQEILLVAFNLRTVCICHLHLMKGMHFEIRCTYPAFKGVHIFRIDLLYFFINEKHVNTIKF